jgi:hypothetical protein
MLTARKEESEQPYYMGNVQLMEARFLELSSAIRALYKSNNDLQEALQECPGDVDFTEAIHENQGIIVKQRKELMAIVQGMRDLGANADVPDDIQTMDVKVSSGLPTNLSATSSQNQNLPAATSHSGDDENPEPSVEDQGLYL